MNQIIEIGVDGMECDACVQSVEAVVGRLSGVESVSVDLDSALATITYDDECITIADLNEAIEDAGFDVALA